MEKVLAVRVEDQASLNTAKDKTNNSSATSKQIKEMKKQLSDPMYLSVTATPQANIFLNEWSALRPDSIRLIQPGSVIFFFLE